VTVYASKDGKAETAEGRKCLCNSLMANIGNPQVRTGKSVENGLVTVGNDLVNAARFLRPGSTEYSASDVITALLAPSRDR
jgi:nitronate monooxygenase